MLANRTFALLTLTFVALAYPAAAIGQLPPTATLPTDAVLDEVPTAGRAQREVTSTLPGSPDVAASALFDAKLAEVEALLAEAKEKASIAARQAHAVDKASARLQRLAEHAEARGSGEIDGASDPAMAADRARQHLEFVIACAASESQAARGDAFALADRAHMLAQKRANEAATLDISVSEKVRLLAETAMARAQASADAASDPQALAERMVVRAQRAADAAASHLAEIKAAASTDPDAVAAAERALAHAEQRLAAAQSHADLMADMFEAQAHAAIDAPQTAPFDLAESARDDAMQRVMDPVLG